jgi:hypothetical protein
MLRGARGLHITQIATIYHLRRNWILEANLSLGVTNSSVRPDRAPAHLLPLSRDYQTRRASDFRVLGYTRRRADVPGSALMARPRRWMWQSLASAGEGEADGNRRDSAGWDRTCGDVDVAQPAEVGPSPHVCAAPAHDRARAVKDGIESLQIPDRSLIFPAASETIPCSRAQGI